MESDQLNPTETAKWQTAVFCDNQLRFLFLSTCLFCLVIYFMSSVFSPHSIVHRGCSYSFGYAAVEQFLKDNNLLTIIRGHSVQKLGAHEHTFFAPCKTTMKIPAMRASRFLHKIPAAEKAEALKRWPPTITVFSAPNYCDRFQNHAAVLEVKEDTYEIRAMDKWQPHPYYLPNFQNAVDFSMPHISRMFKMTFTAMLNVLITSDSNKKVGELVLEDMKKTGEIAEYKRTLKPGNVLTRFDRNLQKFETILQSECINEMRPTTADWKSLNKTYSSPNLLKMFKQNDMKGRQMGTLTSRNDFHRVASAKLPKMRDGAGLEVFDDYKLELQKFAKEIGANTSGSSSSGEGSRKATLQDRYKREKANEQATAQEKGAPATTTDQKKEFRKSLARSSSLGQLKGEDNTPQEMVSLEELKGSPDALSLPAKDKDKKDRDKKKGFSLLRSKKNKSSNKLPPTTKNGREGDKQSPLALPVDSSAGKRSPRTFTKSPKSAGRSTPSGASRSTEAVAQQSMPNVLLPAASETKVASAKSTPAVGIPSTASAKQTPSQFYNTTEERRTMMMFEDLLRTGKKPVPAETSAEEKQQKEDKVTADLNDIATAKSPPSLIVDSPHGRGTEKEKPSKEAEQKPEQDKKGQTDKRVDEKDDGKDGKQAGDAGLEKTDEEKRKEKEESFYVPKANRRTLVMLESLIQQSEKDMQSAGAEGKKASAPVDVSAFADIASGKSATALKVEEPPKGRDRSPTRSRGSIFGRRDKSPSKGRPASEAPQQQPKEDVGSRILTQQASKTENDDRKTDFYKSESRRTFQLMDEMIKGNKKAKEAEESLKADQAAANIPKSGTAESLVSLELEGINNTPKRHVEELDVRPQTARGHREKKEREKGAGSKTRRRAGSQDHGMSTLASSSSIPSIEALSSYGESDLEGGTQPQLAKRVRLRLFLNATNCLSLN